MPAPHRRAAALVALAVVLAACAGDDRAGAPSTAEETTTSAARPPGPAADLVEITGPGQPFVGEAVPPDLADQEQHEYVAAGTATDYAPIDGLPADGGWTFEPSSTADYRTRILVRRPVDAERFSGTVVVEWFNVSGGLDGNPDYTSLAAEILRQGHIWVGVSAQRIGVEGGPVLVTAPAAAGLAGKGLKAIDPARYETLVHPGDGYAFDIYTQVARALRQGAPALGGLEPEVLLAVGESQSAVALTTYYNGVQPLTEAFDGFLLHSRAFAALPLVAPGEHADLAGSLTGPEAVLLRDDLDAPALTLQAEGDVTGLLRSVDARQPDTDRLRLWEVAGTSHADAFLLGPVAELLDCGGAINSAPFHLVAKAGLRALDTWVRAGAAPPVAPRLAVTDGPAPELGRDPDGIALDGIRLPVVDVPVDVLSGEPAAGASLLCLLMGSTRPLPPERIAERYPDRAAYEDEFRRAADATVAAGFVLDDDRQALLDEAQPERVG
jgi:hypothetical protein